MSSQTAFGRRRATAVAGPTYGGASQRAKPTPSSASGAPPAFAPVLRLFFSFKGRLRRRDYWFAYITTTVVMYVLLWAETSLRPVTKDNLALLLPFALFSLALPVVFIWSILAIQVKRWHDRDKSWPWLFVGFIPLIGWVWLFVELGCLDGTPGENSYGYSPKLGPAAVFA